MELFHVLSNSRIDRDQHIDIDVDKEYNWFCATRGRDTLVVVVSYKDKKVCLHRLNGILLQELKEIRLDYH